MYQVNSPKMRLGQDSARDIGGLQARLRWYNIKMVKIGKRELGKIPAMALAVGDQEDAKALKSACADLLEIRVDQFSRIDPASIRGIIKERKKIGIPLILTIRAKEEGGEKIIPDELKARIFRENISLVDAIDIELRSAILPEVVKAARESGKTIIVSTHNLKITPSDRTLRGILSKAKKAGAHIVKIAAMANKEEDVNRLARFTIENKSKNITTISLGKIGSISRLAFPGMGSLITYTFVGRPSGLGQVRLNNLREHLRVYYPKYDEYWQNKNNKKNH